MRDLIISSLACVVFFTSLVHSEPLKGASYIGICNPNFPCSRALRIQPQALGYLADAFGRDCACLKKALTSATLQYVRVHISNGTCFPERGRRCTEKDVFHNESQASTMRKILSGDVSIYRRFARSLERSIRLLESSGKVIRYSPMLESPFPASVRRRLLTLVARRVGKERTVDSVTHQKCLDGYICEKHGDSPKYKDDARCISDLDGITLFEADLEGLKSSSRQCEAILYWTTGFNLLPYGYKGGFIPPWRRSHKAYAWEFEGLKGCLE